MKKIIEFFVDRSLLVNLITIMVFVVGIISAVYLKKDTFPEVDFDVISVSTIYPKSTPEDVEKLITIDMERAIKEVEGIKELNALSLEGRSVITITVDPDYLVDDVLEDVKNAVDRVDELPEESEEPIITKFVNTQRSVLKIAISGDDHEQVRDISRKLRDVIELDQNVAKVELEGYRETDIYVEVSPDKMERYQLTIGEVANAIQNRNISLSGGKIQAPGQDLLIRTMGEFEGADDIKDVVVRSNATGSQVSIKDIAIVKKELEEDSIIERAQGKESIYLNVKKKLTADVIQVNENAKEKVESFFKERKPKGIEYIYVDDLSFYVKRRLGVLTENGLSGLLLVLVCLLFFMNFRVSVITSLGAPFAFLTALVAMEYLGISLNLISMFGLILVLGMLVDDSIIVAERFYHHLEEGQKPRAAAINSAVETVRPITATILTTMIAFGSLFFMGGIMGKFLWPVPAVVIICLIASWLECFFILPGHLKDFAKIKSEKLNKRRWYDPLADNYQKVLCKFLKYPLLTILAFILALIGSVFIVKTMKFELFPGDDVRTVMVSIKGPVGTPLEDTEKVVEKIEKEILAEAKKDTELENLRSIVGQQIKRHGGTRTGSHYASFILYITDPRDRERSTDDILNAIYPRIEKVSQGFEISTEKVAGGPPKGRAIEIVLRGDSLQELKDAANEIKSSASNMPGVLNSELDYEDGKIQYIIDVNENEAKRLGLSTAQVAREIRLAFAGDSLTEIKGSEEDIEIKIRFDEKSRSDAKSIEELYVLNNSNKRIKVSQVAQIRTEKGAFVIRRLDRKRTISVLGDVNKDVITPVGFTFKAKDMVESILKKYPDITYEFAGENKDTNESMVRLARASMIALFLIFIVLVTMFGSIGQPLVIMSAIPLGLIGVVITFKVMGKAFGFMAMMGIVGLVGVVVNDSIVLVNFINLKRQRFPDITEAIAKAARSRFRPIILTTFTTVASLLPIAHATGGDPFLKPMALSFAWGLLFSTAVTLIFVPCAYFKYNSIKEFFHRLKLKVFKTE